MNTCENSVFGPHLGLGRQKNVIRLGKTPDVGFCLVCCCGFCCSLLVPGYGFLFLGACVDCASMWAFVHCSSGDFCSG